jgi:hypothetical protein
MQNLWGEDPPIEDMLKRINEKCNSDLIQLWNKDSTPLSRQYKILQELESLPASKLLQKLGINYVFTAQSPPVQFKTEDTIFSRRQIAKKLSCNTDSFWGRLKLNYLLGARYEFNYSIQDGAFLKPVGDEMYEVVLYHMTEDGFLGANWQVISADGHNETIKTNVINFN